MASTLWLQVVQALAQRWVSLGGYRSPGTSTDGCTVFLATQVGLEDSAGDFVVVAWSGDPDAVVSPGGVVQTRGPMDRTTRPRDESGTVAVRITAQDGDTDPAGTLIRAMSYLADLEDMLRADPTVGIPARRLVTQLAGFTVLPYSNRGQVVEVDVTVTYSARI